MTCHYSLSVSDCVIHSRSLYNSVRNKSKTALHREVIYSCAQLTLSPFLFFFFESDFYMPCAYVYIPVTFNLFTIVKCCSFFFLSFVVVKSLCLRFQCAGVLYFSLSISEWVYPCFLPGLCQDFVVC